MSNTMKHRSKAEAANAWNHTRSDKNSGGRVNDCRTSVGEHVRYYLLNTSLHGLKYIGLTSITLFER